MERESGEDVRLREGDGDREVESAKKNSPEQRETTQGEVKTEGRQRKGVGRVLAASSTRAVARRRVIEDPNHHPAASPLPSVGSGEACRSRSIAPEHETALERSNEMIWEHLLHRFEEEDGRCRAEQGRGRGGQTVVANSCNSRSAKTISTKLGLRSSGIGGMGRSEEGWKGSGWEGERGG